MLKCEVSKEEINIQVEGTVVDLSSDVVLLIKNIYDGLKDEEIKEIFKNNIKNALKEEIPFISEEEIVEILKKQKEENA